MMSAGRPLGEELRQCDWDWPVFSTYFLTLHVKHIKFLLLTGKGPKMNRLWGTQVSKGGTLQQKSTVELCAPFSKDWITLQQMRPLPDTGEKRDKQKNAPKSMFPRRLLLLHSDDRQASKNEWDRVRSPEIRIHIVHVFKDWFKFMHSYLQHFLIVWICHLKVLLFVVCIS